MNNMTKAPVTTLGTMNAGAAFLSDSAIATGKAFLEGELEKLDSKILEPLTSVTWARDLPIKTGGGFVDSVSSIDVSYEIAGGPESGLIAGETNNIPVIQANFGKQSWRTFNWSNVLQVFYVDQQKLSQIGRNLEEVLNKGLKLNHDKTLDMNAYVGFGRVGTYGLVNSPDIARMNAPNGASGKSTWADLTPDEILNIVNYAIQKTWENCEFDLSGMANHILIPPTHYTSLVQRKVGVTGDKSILTFLLENNIGKDQGNQVKIDPCRWCIGAGSGEKDRMVVYANNIERVHFENTVPLRRVTTQMVAEKLSYVTPFIGQFSEVKWLYPQTALYIDGI